MRRLSKVMLGGLALASLLLVVLLVTLLFGRVFYERSVQGAVQVEPFATSIVIIKPEDFTAFSVMIGDFSQRNGLSLENKTYNVNGKTIRYFGLTHHDTEISVSNDRTSDEFDITFFVKSQGVKEADLPEKFTSAIRQRFGDAAIARQ